MKKFKSLFLIMFCCIFITKAEEVELFINVKNPGTLSDLIIDQGYRPMFVTKIKISGTLNEYDFKILNETMTSLSHLDLYNITNTSNINFENHKSLKKIILPKNLSIIERYAFSNCFYLKSVIFPNNLIEIHGYAFSGCNSLDSITIPNTVIKIKDNVFSLCTSLKHIVLSENIDSIHSLTFNYCNKLDSIKIPNNITFIGNSAFRYCTSLKQINIPQNLKKIDADAFEECTSLSKILIPNLTTWYNIDFISNPLTLESDLYLNNEKVIDYTIPNNITEIKNNTFKNCKLIKKITIPSSIKKIGKNAFANCINLDSVDINEGTIYIEENAFSQCNNLNYIKLPQSLKEINHGAFTDCKNLTSIIIPDSITTIKSYTFKNCKSLNKISLKNKITQIMNGAFENCSSLKSITIPCSTKDLANYCFQYCSNLDTIICLGNKPPKANNLGYGIDLNKCQLIVPKVAYKEYIKDSFWSNFYNISTIDIDYKEVNIKSNNQNWGYINTTGGYYNKGDNITIKAIPNKNYHLVKWNDGEINPIRTIKILSDTTFIAEFAIDSFYISGISSNGTIEGTGRYAYNTEVYINAIPNKGYHFIQWSDGNTENPRTIVVTQDSTFTAQFAINTYNVTLSVENGSAIGGGEYNHGEKATLTASPNKGYHFIQWSDGNTDNPRIVIVTQDSTFTAEFEINTYNITLSAENGSIIGEDKYNHGEKATLIASPNKGYHFTQWSDGNTDNPRIVIITQDSTFTAIFEANSFSISTDVNDDAMGSVTEGGEYTYGTEITLTAIANEGYCFVKWSDEITDNPRTVIVTEDKTYIAEFRVASTSVENTTNSNISIFTTGNTLHIEGATGDYYILDATGRLIYSGNASTLTLPRGIYLITMGGETQKIVL